jgi:hypothetical protein
VGALITLYSGISDPLLVRVLDVLSRADPESLDSRRMVCSKAPEHDADHGETDEASNGGGIALEVARQASVAADPRERPFDDPAFWQNLESVSIRPLDNLQSPNAGGISGFTRTHSASLKSLG